MRDGTGRWTTLLSKQGHLSLDGVWSPTLFLSTSIGHNAVGTALVASVDDIDPGCDVGTAAWFGDVLFDLDLLRCDDLISLIRLIQ